jgi:2-haloacid dehalogenase
MQTARFGGFAAIVFDAYGTLFDVDALDQSCARVTAQPADLVRIWRSKQLEYANLRTIMDRYADWGQITSDALDYATNALRLEFGPAQRRTLMRAWLELPAFPDVLPALERFAGSHLRLLILSNGTRQMLEPLVAINGLSEHISSILTSEPVQAFKPDPGIYGQVQEVVHARINEILFVSSNGFDVAGAKAVGFTVCRVDRRGDPLDPLGYDPDLHVRDLRELADLLLGDINETDKGREG